MNNIKKIDIHAHAVAFQSTYPPYYSGERFISPEELIEEYDKIGVEKGVLLPLVSPEATLSPISSENCRYIAEKFSDRFDWFCNIDPRAGGNNATCDLGCLINFYKELGAKGIGEVTANLYADDPMLTNLFSAAAECDMPVIIHIAVQKGNMYGIIDDKGLPKIEKILKKHPKLKLVGHSMPFWGEISSTLTEEERMGYPEGKVVEGRILELMREYPNLYCDLSAKSGANALMRDADFTAKFLEEFSDRIMYGCDICIKNLDYPTELDKFFDKMLNEKALTMENYVKIVRDNAIRILKLSK